MMIPVWMSVWMCGCVGVLMCVVHVIQHIETEMQRRYNDVRIAIGETSNAISTTEQSRAEQHLDVCPVQLGAVPRHLGAQLQQHEADVLVQRLVLLAVEDALYRLGGVLACGAEW